MASVTPVGIVSLFFQVVILGTGEFRPAVRPETLSKVLRISIGTIALILTLLGISLCPAKLPIEPGPFGAGMVAVALLAPVVGILEGRYRSNGLKVYSPDRGLVTWHQIPSGP
jgi:hypothetical protein